jgi:predicted nucleic acid-binding protein
VSSYAFDANILIDALGGVELAYRELVRATEGGQRLWVSRVAWIEVLSKGLPHELSRARLFLSGFAIDELDPETAELAAALRRERRRLRAADAIILASAQVRGRILVTRNIKDFPLGMPGIRVPYSLNPKV